MPTPTPMPAFSAGVKSRMPDQCLRVVEVGVSGVIPVCRAEVGGGEAGVPVAVAELAPGVLVGNAEKVDGTELIIIADEVETCSVLDDVEVTNENDLDDACDVSVDDCVVEFDKKIVDVIKVESSEMVVTV